MVQQVKDPALLQLWLGFIPCHGNVHMPQVQPIKKKPQNHFIQHMSGPSSKCTMFKDCMQKILLREKREEEISYLVSI